MYSKKHQFKVIEFLEKYFLFCLLFISTITFVIDIPEEYNVPVADIIVSLIPMIFTILILSLSISDKEIFGVKISVISRHRKDFHFSFVEMIVVAILLFVFASVCQIFHITISVWVADIIGVIYSIWFLIQEMPFIRLDNEKIKNILAKNIKIPNTDDKLGNASTNAFNNAVLQYIIFQEGLYNAYNIVKNDDESYNKQKMLDLISMTTNFYYDLLQRKESDFARNSLFVYKDIEFFTAIDNAFLDLERLLDYQNKENLARLLGKDSYYLVTRLLFALYNLSILINFKSRYIAKASYLFRSIIRSINFKNYSEEEISLCNKIIINMAVYSISKDEKPSLWFYEMLRDEVFDIKFLYKKEQGYFWFLSMYLYFLSQVYKRTPINLRTTIDEFMKTKSKGLNSDGINWSDAIHLYMNHGDYNMKLKLFIDVISIFRADIGPGPWYMPPFSSSWSSADGEFSLQFIINNLIGILVYDYNSFYYEKGSLEKAIISQLSQPEMRALSYVLNSNWFNEDNFKCDSNSLDMLCFFSNDFKTHIIINKRADLINDLKDLRNRLVVTSIEKILNDSHITDSKLEEYKNILICGLKNGIKKCNFLSSNLKLSTNDLKEYVILIDTFDSAQLVKGYADSLSNSIFNMLYYDFKNADINTLSMSDSNQDYILDEIIHRNFDYKSKDINLYFDNITNSRNKLKVDKLKTINLHLAGCIFWKKGAIQINAECVDELCFVKKLTDKQISEIVDRDFKLTAGLYKLVGYYNNESAYITREKAMEIVKNKYILAKIVFRKKTFLDNNNILLVVRN